MDWSIITLYFHLNSCEGSDSGGLLDKPWSQVSCLHVSGSYLIHTSTGCITRVLGNFTLRILYPTHHLI